MALNFRISTHRNSDNLHLKLMGDFDTGSALELMNLLKKNIDPAIYKIIIHTNCLDTVYPFGRETFHHELKTFGVNVSRLLFTGEKAGQIAPQKDTFFQSNS